MIASCINCNYTADVEIRHGCVTSLRRRRTLNQKVPDVFICTLCMEGMKW